MAKIKAADRIRALFNSANSSTRWQWKKVNQKGYEYSNDNQLSSNEKNDLEEQGMPTFTINRISPVVEMLNFYATANNPRWQAIGKEGSDTDVAAVFSDLAEYVWQLSDGDTMYSNVSDIIEFISEPPSKIQIEALKEARNLLLYKWNIWPSIKSIIDERS